MHIGWPVQVPALAGAQVERSEKVQALKRLACFGLS
jgi:hypothetical protein